MTGRVMRLTVVAMSTIVLIASQTGASASQWEACMRFCYTAYTKANPAPVPRERKPGDPIRLDQDALRRGEVIPAPPSRVRVDGKWSWERFKTCKKECFQIR